MPEHIEHRTNEAAQDTALDELMLDFRREIDRAVTTALRRLQALAPSRSNVVEQPVKLISVGAAGLKAGLSDDRVRALCREHPHGTSPGGFGFKMGGRWRVVEPMFLKYLDREARRRRRP